LQGLDEVNYVIFKVPFWGAKSGLGD